MKIRDSIIKRLRWWQFKHFPLEPQNFIQKIMAIGGFISFFFGLWQMDLICVGPVWSSFWQSPAGGYFAQVFEFGRIDIFGHIVKFTTTIGVAYDTCQALLVIGLIVAVLAFWLWDSEPQCLNIT